MEKYLLDFSNQRNHNTMIATNHCQFESIVVDNFQAKKSSLKKIIWVQCPFFLCLMIVHRLVIQHQLTKKLLQWLCDNDHISTTAIKVLNNTYGCE